MPDSRRSPSPNRRGFPVLIGGAEDKDHDRSLLRRIVELRGGRTVRVIPAVTQIPDVLDVRIRADALSGRHREPIR